MEAPAEINVGQTLKVMGNSTLPAGTSFDLVMYYTKYTSTEIDRRTVTLQDYNNKTFIIPFSTRGLKGGLYKIELQSGTRLEESLSSDSITQLLVNVIDRSGEITINSPMTQDIKEALMIQGSITKLGDAGVKLEVRGPEGPVFGPTWIETKKDMKQGDGEFTKTINVNLAGDYDVSFTDAKGYIGAVTFHVTSPTPTPTVAETTPLRTQATIKTQITTIPTLQPTPTKSPLPLPLILLALSLIAGVKILSSGTKKGLITLLKISSVFFPEINFITYQHHDHQCPTKKENNCRADQG
jgi:hypothetical protein